MLRRQDDARHQGSIRFPAVGGVSDADGSDLRRQNERSITDDSSIGDGVASHGQENVVALPAHSAE